MKINKFFSIVLLGAVVLFGTNFEVHASQSWYDWGTLGVKSVYQAMPSMSIGMPDWAVLGANSVVFGIGMIGMMEANATRIRRAEEEWNYIWIVDRKLKNYLEKIYFKGQYSSDEMPLEEFYGGFISLSQNPAFQRAIADENINKELLVRVMNGKIKELYENYTEKILCKKYRKSRKDGGGFINADGSPVDGFIPLLLIQFRIDENNRIVQYEVNENQREERFWYGKDCEK